MAYELEKKVALEAVLQAAKLCQAVQAEMVTPEALEKGDRSPVTVADFGSQALVCRRLRAKFAEDEIVGEEDSAALQAQENEATLQQVVAHVRKFEQYADASSVCEWIDAGNGTVSDRYWTLDPIDGTKGFLRNDQYAIALALVEEGDLKVGVLACPMLSLALSNPVLGKGVVFVAVRGEGARMARLNANSVAELQFIPIGVTSTANQIGLRFVESVEAAHANHELQQKIAAAAGINQKPLRIDSQAKYAAVARGDASLYLRLPKSPDSPYREKIWDHAAGAILVQEAGGTVTDLHGQPLDFASGAKMSNNRGVVVSNGALHKAVIEALTEHWG